MHHTKSKFFRHLISHLDFFKPQKTAHTPLTYRHSQAILKHEKKIKSGYNILPYSDY